VLKFKKKIIPAPKV